MHIFIDELGDGAERTLTESAGDKWEERLIHLDSLEKRAERTLTKFSQGKCQLLLLGRDNPSTSWGPTRLERSSAEKVLGVLWTPH